METITVEQALKSANDGKNQDIKGKFVGQHVFCNVNTLVEYCLSKGHEDSDSPIQYDDIENLYSYPEYYGKIADFAGGSDEQRQAEIDRLNEMLDADDFASEEVKQTCIDEINELENLDTEAVEIFEWWAVSEFLYRKLKENGYCVIDAGSCYVWGRTTTGQAILLDYAISKICADMGILEGQEYDWSR